MTAVAHVIQQLQKLSPDDEILWHCVRREDWNPKLDKARWNALLGRVDMERLAVEATQLFDRLIEDVDLRSITRRDLSIEPDISALPFASHPGPSELRG